MRYEWTILLLLLQLTAASGADDRYRFSPRPGWGAVQEVRLRADASGAHFRARLRPGWDTALLGVRVKSAAPLPWVEVRAGGVRERQYLDPGAQGLRWLNVSALSGQIGVDRRVELEAHDVAFTSGRAMLWLFSNHLDLGGPILVLAPHPDDAEIAAFGLYAGRNATVVTVTCGNAGDMTYRESIADPAAQFRFKGWLRAVDSVTVPWQGGIPPERCFNLGYFDGRLADMRREPDAAIPEVYGPNQDTALYRRANVGRLLPVEPRSNSWRHLVEDLGAVLEKVRPAVVVAPHPLMDTHGDHDHTTVALSEALERYPGAPSVLLYTNHAFREAYPFGPAGSGVSLPPFPGAPLLVPSVYSHPVDPDLQRRKLYALESMHDLRLTPLEQAACGTTPAAPRRISYPRVYENDYFRRAVRTAEIFVATDQDGLRNVVRQFLANHP